MPFPDGENIPVNVDPLLNSIRSPARKAAFLSELNCFWDPMRYSLAEQGRDCMANSQTKKAAASVFDLIGVACLSLVIEPRFSSFDICGEDEWLAIRSSERMCCACVASPTSPRLRRVYFVRRLAPSEVWWWGKDSNLRRLSREIYSLVQLTTLLPHRAPSDSGKNTEWISDVKRSEYQLTGKGPIAPYSVSARVMNGHIKVEYPCKLPASNS